MCADVDDHVDDGDHDDIKNNWNSNNNNNHDDGDSNDVVAVVTVTMNTMKLHFNDDDHGYNEYDKITIMIMIEHQVFNV